MRLRIKKFLSTVLCLSMLLGMMGNISYATDMTDNSEDIIEMGTEADVGLNYTYVEKPYLETPDTQNIVVSWGNGTEQISNAQIIVLSEDGITEEWACVQNIDNLYLFSKEYVDETERNTYQVTDFRFVQDGEQHEISMLDLNAKVEFGVNKEYEEYGKNITPLDIGDVGMSVVTIDENGQTEAQDDIQAALKEVTTRNMRMAKKRNSGIVVALDPGHDDRHGGASHNGLVEQDLTLKIANYAKEELETYRGVQVYMTRTTSACPYPETIGTGKCIEQRMIAAARAGANIYVSIHLNSTNQDTAPNGAEVIYPNSNWKPQVGAEGKVLAQSILNELVKLGLNSRGIYCKDSTIDERYEDGSKSDYFSVQIYGKEQGIPGIIVEHAFMTNASDVNNFLRTEEGLRRLGVADATGIANTYGLTKVPTVISAIAASQDEREYLLKAENMSGSFQSVSFAVWSIADGQDDIVWYNGVKDSNRDWNATAIISNHRTEGTYYVHVYGVTAAGTQKFIGSTEFEVSPVRVGTFRTDNYNQDAGSFDVIIDDIEAVSGVTRIHVPVWSAAGQSDIRWYEAEKQSDGSYRVQVKISNHNYNIGRYNIHMYLYTNNGLTCFKGTSQEVKEPKVTITAKDEEGTEKAYKLKVENVQMAGNFQSMSFAVWSAEGGQDDLVWYKGTKVADGDWNAIAVISNHKTEGTYYVHVYGVTTAGVQKFVGSTEFRVSSASVGTLRVENYNQNAGSFDVVIDVIKAVSGVTNVRVPVWSSSNQSDIRWYEAEKQSDGSYKVQVKISNHNYNVGKYHVHMYLYTNNGLTCFKGTSQEVKEPKVTITAKDEEGTEKAYKLKVENIQMAGNFQSMSFAVWSTEGGQDDLIWYGGTKDSNGDWNATVTISKHKTAGNYNVHVYGITAAGVQKFVGSTEFLVSSVNVGILRTENYNRNAGSFDVVIDDIEASSGVTRIQVPVWSAPNQGDIRWYEAEKQSDGSYKVQVKISNHNYNVGRYHVHMYLNANNGLTCFKEVSQEVKEPKVIITAIDLEGTGQLYQLKAENAGIAGDFQSVNFAVWSTEDGQDDLVWYGGTKDSNGDWNAIASVRDHKTAGGYLVDVYGITTTGVQKFLGRTSFEAGYSIMGKTTTTVDQMVRYYVSSRAVYPADALAKGGAGDIRTFCQIYYEEAAAEGVRAEVAFAQAMNETGFLKFGGIVKVEQFNFAGIGALDGNVSGQCATFPDVRTGVRAQIQHLKAYASTERLNNTCVDPRFSLVTRGCAPYVQWLGIHENPIGKGWASAKNYGYNLVDKYISVLKQQ